VFGDLAQTQTYCKLQERIDKYDYAAIHVWDCLDEEFGYRNKELDTVHAFIDGKPGAPSVHFAFRRLMPHYRYEGIIKIFKGREWDHKTLVTGWTDFAERQYARTFQRRHPTREQTVREGRILEGAQFCFGYREEEGGFDTYWAQVVRPDWIRNDVASPRQPGEYDWTITLVLDYCLTVAFFQDDAPNPIATLRQRSQPIVSMRNFDQQDYALREPGVFASCSTERAQLLGRISSPPPYERPPKRAWSPASASSEQEGTPPPCKRKRYPKEGQKLRYRPVDGKMGSVGVLGRRRFVQEDDPWDSL
jgi:hypothetical protein